MQLAILERVAAGPRVAALATRLGAERDATRAEFADRFAGYDTKRVRRTFDQLVDDLRGRSR